ncbi:dihydroneopterin aldolase [Stigmatella aurantiaca]|uniref:Dihydroneopterin aldolase n=1 Tax=Stigmatella aurantiaca (strain DW4/3-1) TaxID=378806 RepID=Q094W4_STIAD|nr:dihydroneopterin aldolase [Stigmatella aurantiaca]ADO71357.1 dihydroneopterin aldolase [Stigmatella aurantiaca DW4/3-1]EAU67277.1 FolB domain protein [Stigmatella aurantiaca DW4/3-1]
MNEPLRLPVETDGQGRLLDVIELRDFTVKCFLGASLLGGEAAQRVSLDVAMFLDTRRAAMDGHLAHTVHYGRLAGELRFLLESCRFETLEPVAEAVASYVLLPPSPDAPHVQVRAVTVRVVWADAPQGQAVPAVQVHRRHGSIVYGVEAKPFGRVDIVCERPRYGIYRLRIKPGGFIPTHMHQQMEESELVLGSGLLLQGRAVLQGMVFHWPKGFAHRYDNPTEIEQSVLCVDRPGFIPADEVELEEPQGGLQPVQGHSYYPAEDPHLT